MPAMKHLSTAALVAVLMFGIHPFTNGSLLGQQWTELNPSGGPPAPRGFLGATAVYDSASDRMIVFGGFAGFPPFNDVWVLTNPAGTGPTPQWLNLISNGATGSPAPRSGHSAVYDQATDRMIIFGGCGGGCFPIINDTWVLKNASGLAGTPQWQQLFPSGSPPSGRQSHVAAYDSSNNRMIVFGGQNGSGSGGATFAEVWILTNANGVAASQWSLLSTSGGPAPGQYAARGGYDPSSNRLVVFGGGAQGTGAATDAVWVLSNANGLGGPAVWTNIIPEGSAGSPSPRGFHSAIFDPSSNRMTIFGSPGNDTWVLEDANGLGTASWSQLSPVGPLPPTRCCNTAVFDAATNRMTIFSGNGGGTSLNDTWVLTDAVGPIVDTQPPALTIDATVDGNNAAVADGGSTLSNTLTLSFTATDAGTVNVTCEVDSGGAALCVSPLMISGLSVGGHLVELIATDGANNTAPATFEWTVVTPAQASENLIDAVEALVDSGSLNGGQGNALTSKLDGVLKQLAKGKNKPATNQLQAMLNQVGSLVEDGVLTASEGQSLSDAINAIVAAI